jgi:hypothetical protein
MKASRHFYGTDSYGRAVEKAEGINGQWFGRHKIETDFGLSMTKWYPIDTPTFETHGTNEYTGERFEYRKPVLFWGFNKMKEIDGPHRIRLPNCKVFRHNSKAIA